MWGYSNIQEAKTETARRRERERITYPERRHRAAKGIKMVHDNADPYYQAGKPAHLSVKGHGMWN